MAADSSGYVLAIAPKSGFLGDEDELFFTPRSTMQFELPSTYLRYDSSITSV